VAPQTGLSGRSFTSTSASTSTSIRIQGFQAGADVRVQPRDLRFAGPLQAGNVLAEAEAGQLLRRGGRLRAAPGRLLDAGGEPARLGGDPAQSLRVVVTARHPLGELRLDP